MPTIDRLALPHGGWDAIVAAIHRWGDAFDVQWRDAIVLLPFAQLLPLARRAWAAGSGVLPRIETTETLARSLAPPEAASPGQISFDVAIDRLVAARLLQGQPWARQRAARDPLYGARMVESLVDAARAIARAAAAVSPARRAAHWQRVRELFAASDAPGATERALVRIALEWAAASADPSTDRLFVLAPAAWVVVQAGGEDRLSRALVDQAAAGTRCLVLDTDVAQEAPFELLAAKAQCGLAAAADFEDEARRAAAQVLAHLREGRAPVALIAQDRALVRRARALLARRQVPIADETGWALSTTRAAALLTSLLGAMSERASCDDILDWLKTCPAARETDLDLLEAGMRRHRWSNPHAVDAARTGAGAAALWHDVQRRRHEATVPAERALAEWLDWLRSALEQTGQWAVLASDDAGMQVLAALHLQASGSTDPAWRDAADSSRMTLPEFARFAESALEAGRFVPEAPEAGPHVVITPLARAMLRPFAAVVFPGADERRLGPGASRAPLVCESEAKALGIDDAKERAARELLAFAQLLRLPRVSILYRMRDDDEALSASPLVLRLALALRRAGRELPRHGDAREAREAERAPVPRPQPVAPALLPESLSASAIDALRDCPYRFFALHMLRLSEPRELDAAIEARDYGSWLHAVLHRFHRDRDPGAGDAAQLAAAAEAERDALGLDAAEFVPFGAQFDRFVPRYLRWQRARDAEGAVWSDGEARLSARLAALSGIDLRGVIDRIDRLPGNRLRLIDYKTGSTVEVRRRVRQEPAEDTQLAVYAALGAERGARLEACYLPLDDGQDLQPIEHPDVATSAAMLLQGLGGELQRLREGAPLPALGEGSACEFCAARGVCRRDDWR